MNTEFLRCSGEDCFVNNRFQNNFLNDIIDHVSYRGVSIEQRPEVLYKFENLILESNPARIIEIGTFAGGLTLILKDIVDANNLSTEIYTYDVAEATILKDHIQQRQLNKLFVRTKNLFNGAYSDFFSPETKQEIQELIQQPGLTILLCDGGCKKCEFNLLASFLKPEDIIMAHDYAPNSTFFQNQMNKKIWNWHEIQNSDIEMTIMQNGLVPLHKEAFLEVAWLCMRKR